MRDKGSQSRCFVPVSPWFVENGPRATISFLWWFCTLKQIFQTTNSFKDNIKDNTCGPKWKYILYKSLDVLKTYFSTMSPRDRYNLSMELKKIQNDPKSIFMQHNMSVGDTYVLHNRFFVIQIKIIKVIIRCIKYLSRGDIEIFGMRHRKFVRGAIRWPVVFF